MPVLKLSRRTVYINFILQMVKGSVLKANELPWIFEPTNTKKFFSNTECYSACPSFYAISVCISWAREGLESWILKASAFKCVLPDTRHKVVFRLMCAYHMIRSLWHKSVGTGNPTQGKVFIYRAVNNQTGLAGTSNEIYLGQRRSDAAWCGKKNLTKRRSRIVNTYPAILSVWKCGNGLLVRKTRWRNLNFGGGGH